MTFQPGLQTHFPNDRIPLTYLEQVQPRVFWMRVDAQKADPTITQLIVDDITGLARQPLITCWSSADLAGLPPSHVEYQNERSIKLGNVPALPGSVYRHNWDTEFWPAVKAGGHRGYFGAAANFEKRDLDWYRNTNASTLPPEVVCTIHDYWTGADLASRLALWRGIIGLNRDYLISECGINGLDPAGIAAYMTKKWDFWSVQPHCLGLVYFQIFDDVINHIPMGIYDGNLQLKQVVYETFPLVEDPMSAVSQTPLFKFDHQAVIHNADGTKSLRWGAGQTDAASNQVFSLQPDGSYQTRPDTAIGAWEKGTVKGDRLVFATDEARAVFAWQD